MTKEEIINKAESLAPWYHRIKLIDDYYTPSNMKLSWPIWEMIRRVRSGIDYVGTSVLDVGSMDGMWAFEAEDLGAEYVCAIDVWQSPTSEQRITLAKQVKNSPMIIRTEDAQSLSAKIRLEEPFNIIQCLGMLYHVENPIMVLRELRNCVRQNGQMLLETSVWNKDTIGPAMRFNSDNGIYCDPTTFWIPNESALFDMLKLTDWISVTHSIERCYEPPSPNSYRICMICQPS